MVTKFMVRAAVLLVLMGTVWERSPVSDYYHRALAACDHAIWSGRDVQLVGDDFVTRVWLNNKSQMLHLEATDLTMNICVLVAVYLASFRPRRVFVWCLCTALLVLFAVHVAALEVTIRAVLAWRESPGTMTVIERLGPWMYPMASLLWVPYIVILFITSAAAPATRSGTYSVRRGRQRLRESPFGARMVNRVVAVLLKAKRGCERGIPMP